MLFIWVSATNLYFK